MKKMFNSNLLVSTVFAIAGIFCHGGSKVQALTFNFTSSPETSEQAIKGFTDAGKLWSDLLSDNVTVNIDIAFTDLGAGILASASFSSENISYSNFRNALNRDRTSADDFIAVANLTNTSAFNLLINRTSDNPNGSLSDTPYLDNDGGANNSTIRLTSANSKALKLLSASNAASDASISFNTGFKFDFDPSNGIANDMYDFVGIAAHEIGHTLGFVSGVDNLDYNTTSSPDDFFTSVSPLDLFRFSDASYAAGKGTIDWTADNRPKYFSIDGGTTSLIANAFSTGTNYGDRGQASHWKDNLGIGIMDPTFRQGELGSISDLDIQAFDVIGWNRTTVTVPEPLTILGSMIALGFGTFFQRKLSKNMTSQNAQEKV